MKPMPDLSNYDEFVSRTGEMLKAASAIRPKLSLFMSFSDKKSEHNELLSRFDDQLIALWEHQATMKSYVSAVSSTDPEHHRKALYTDDGKKRYIARSFRNTKKAIHDLEDTLHELLNETHKVLSDQRDTWTLNESDALREQKRSELHQDYYHSLPYMTQEQWDHIVNDELDGIYGKIESQDILVSHMGRIREQLENVDLQCSSLALYVRAQDALQSDMLDIKRDLKRGR